MEAPASLIGGKTHQGISLGRKSWTLEKLYHPIHNLAPKDSPGGAGGAPDHQLGQGSRIASMQLSLAHVQLMSCRVMDSLAIQSCVVF